MPRTKVDLTYPHDYQVEELVEIASRPAGEKHLYFPGASEEGGHDGVLIRVRPSSASWIGIFAFGYNSPKAITGIYSCPDPGTLCVVAKAQGYLVKANDPHIWEPINAYPILDIRSVISKRLLLFADFTKMSAYGSRGHAWTTSDLSWDGIEIVDVTSEQIKGLAWDSPQQHEVEFLVDVETGKHIGGSSPERYVGAKC